MSAFPPDPVTWVAHLSVRMRTFSAAWNPRSVRALRTADRKTSLGALGFGLGCWSWQEQLLNIRLQAFCAFQSFGVLRRSQNQPSNLISAENSKALAVEEQDKAIHRDYCTTGDQLNPVPSERCFFCGHNHMGIESPKPTSTRIQAMVPPSQDLNPKGSTNRNNHFQTVLSSQLPKRPRVMPPCTAHCRDHRPFNLGFLRAHQNK